MNKIELAELYERAGQWGVDLVNSLNNEIIELNEEIKHLQWCIEDMKDLDNESGN